MKRFKFRLQVVLNERKRVEDNKLREWLTAQNILNQIIRSKEELEVRLREAIHEANDVATSTQNNIGTLHSFDVFIDGTKRRIEWKTQEIERGQKLTEKKRLEYVAASQKRKVLEKIKEKRLHEYVQSMRKKEIKNLDDIYIMRSHLRALSFSDGGEL